MENKLGALYILPLWLYSCKALTSLHTQNEGEDIGTRNTKPEPKLDRGG